MFGFFDMADNYDERLIKNTEVDGGEVDTVSVTDSDKPYETGISHPLYNSGSWIIVELYDTIPEAKKGHEKWVATLKSKPENLTDVSTAEIAEIAGAFGVAQGVFPRTKED